MASSQLGTCIFIISWATNLSRTSKMNISPSCFSLATYGSRMCECVCECIYIYIYMCIAYRTNTLLPHSSQYTYMYTQRYVCLHGCMYACMYVWYTRPGDENTYRSSFAADTLSVAAGAEPFFEFYCFRFCLGLIGLVMSWETL